MDNAISLQLEYAELIEACPVAIGVIQNEKWGFVNKALLELMGFSSEEEVIGGSVWNMVNPELQEAARNQLNYIAQMNPPYSFTIERELIRKDGVVIDVDVTCVPCQFGGKPAVQMIYRDVTTLNSYIERLRYSQSSLQNAQRLARLGSWEWIIRNRDMEKGFFSEETFRIYEFEPASHVTKEQVMSRVHPDDRAMVMHKAALAFSGEPYNYEYRLLCPGNAVKHVRTFGQVIFNEHNDPVRIYGAIQDVTEQKEADRRLKQAESLLLQSEKLQMAGQFAAGIAHEIRNPLTAIKGFLSLLSGASQESRDSYAIIMKEELGRIERIVSEMLMLAKPREASFQSIDLVKIVMESITFIEAQALLKNVEITYNVPTEPVRIQGSEDQIKQVLLNMTKNAMESMTQGGQLAIDLTISGQQACMVFKDTGVGMTEDMIRKLGEPFYSTKENGTGLGVLITKQIIDAHGGTIAYESQLGCGTKVSIYVPVIAG